jgi:hypothetical protein
MPPSLRYSSFAPFSSSTVIEVARSPIGPPFPDAGTTAIRGDELGTGQFAFFAYRALTDLAEICSDSPE